MSDQRPAINAPALQGWRSRAWAWVLFVALCKGLIPHVALASVVMDGSPAMVWCAPGTAAASEAKPGMGSMVHACVCASAGDGALPLSGAELLASVASQPSPQTLSHSAFAVERLRLPPARGPPLL